MRESPILGLFAREGYEQHDTRWLDDEELAAFLPPPVPAPKRPAPRIPRMPRVRMVPERRANPYITRAICGLLWLLVCMGAVSLAAITAMPLS